MDDRRRYQRYTVTDSNTFAQGKIAVEGEQVKLVDFSVGGLCVLSKKSISLGTKRVSVELHDGGLIEW